MDILLGLFGILFGILWLLFGYLAGRIQVALDDDGIEPTSWPRKIRMFLYGFFCCWIMLAVIAWYAMLLVEDRYPAEAVGKGDKA